MGRNHRAIDADQCGAVVAAVASGEPAKSVAQRYGLAYRTLVDILHRAGVSPKATDDPARLRLRERWKRNTAAMRARRVGEAG